MAGAVLWLYIKEPEDGAEIQNESLAGQRAGRRIVTGAQNLGCGDGLVGRRCIDNNNAGIHIDAVFGAFGSGHILRAHGIRALFPHAPQHAPLVARAVLTSS